MVAAAETEDRQSTIPEPIPDRSDIDKGVRTVFLDRVAHVGMMLEKMQRQNRRVERLEKFAATGEVADLEVPANEEDGMGVNIGNENHYHVELKEPPASPTVTPAQPVPVPTASTGNGMLPTLLVGAAMLAGGAGLGYIVNDLLRPTPADTTPSPTTGTDLDTDTVMVVDFPGE